MRSGLLQRLAPFLDPFLVPFVWLAAHQLKLVRRMTPGRARHCMAVLDAVGVYPLIDHYYDPLINLKHLGKPLSQSRQIAGIDFPVDKYMTFFESLSGMTEMLDTPVSAVEGEHQYHFSSTTFGPLDATVLYGIIRRYRPRRIVEIGCGMSTLAALKATQRNAREDSTYSCQHVCIEPYEQPWLETLPVTLLRKKLEEVDSAMVEELQAGDILFIDSSHVIRPQGDVLVGLFDWVGRIKPGVLVHVHDILSPRDYPEDWIFSHRFLWNEQYLLEGFLAFNETYKILLPLNHLFCEKPDALLKACPAQADENRTNPTSFWLTRMK
jgi:hypothetical protein